MKHSSWTHVCTLKWPREKHHSILSIQRKTTTATEPIAWQEEEKITSWFTRLCALFQVIALILCTFRHSVPHKGYCFRSRRLTSLCRNKTNGFVFVWVTTKKPFNVEKLPFRDGIGLISNCGQWSGWKSVAIVSASRARVGGSVVPLFTWTDAESPTPFRLFVHPTEQNVQHELLNTMTPHGSNQPKFAVGSR